MLGHSDKSVRSWFLKYEFIGCDRDVFIRTKLGSHPVIKNRAGLIPEGRFLAFAKAYLNISTYYKGVRSPPKSIVRALICTERALRSVHRNNDPTGMNARVFEKAAKLLEDTNPTPSAFYDVSKELEILAHMVQGGYHSKTFRFADRGFNLLDHPFTFNSSIKARKRKRATSLNSPDLEKKPDRLSAEAVAAAGLAYRKSASLFGPNDTRTFMSSIIGLGLSTVSMRLSDLLTLQRDAIYRSERDPGRHRIRLKRPKTGLSQDLPISTKLADLAEEFFENILKYSAEASEVFQFYIKKYGKNFSKITEIYVPPRLRHYFSSEFISVPDIYKILGMRSVSDSEKLLPQSLGKFPLAYFISQPGDIFSSGNNRSVTRAKFITIERIKAYCLTADIELDIPAQAASNLYVCLQTIKKYIPRGSRHKSIHLLRKLFQNGSKTKKYIYTADLKKWLLDDFKKVARFPHWPYTSKEKTTRLDKALLVLPRMEQYKSILAGDTEPKWWLPTFMTAGQLNSWISNETQGPLLFKLLDIKLGDSTYPSIAFHDTRKYHHTNALIAGAHEVFIDELAGRQSGYQSDHYDLRTPREIILGSIETFDPDEEFQVIGPVIQAANKVKLVDRASFLYLNAAPKHITEVGGCATDWSLDPCKQYGDCMRCDQHIWRKGDKKRLTQILDRRAHAEKMIAVGKEQLNKFNTPPRTLLLQLQQFKDDLDRCIAILDLEADESIAVGTIVTFEQAKGTITASQLTARLAANQNRTGK